MPDPQFHPDAFTVRPEGNQWAVIGSQGEINTVLPTEAQARFYAISLRRQLATPSPPAWTPPPPPQGPAPTGDPVGFGQLFGNAASAMNDNLYQSFRDRFAAGKRVLFSDRPGFEQKIQSFYDQTGNLDRADFDRIKAQHFGGPNRPVAPPPPPPPPPQAPQRPAWTPPQPPPPPPAPVNPFPGGMGGAPPQPPPPVNPFPPGMGWTPPQSQPYAYQAPPIGAFPANMQPPPPPPPKPPPPGFAQQFSQAFQDIFSRQARYGFPNIPAAARGAFAAAAPGPVMALGIATSAKEALESAIRSVKVFAERINESNRALSLYSPALATAFAGLQMGDFRRSMGMARDTEGSAVALTRAIDRMRDSFFPHEVFSRNVQNAAGGFGAGLLKGGAEATKIIPEIGEAIRQFIDPNGDLFERMGEAIATGFFTLLSNGAAIPFVGPGLGIAGMMLNAIIAKLKADGIIKDIKPDPAARGAWDTFLASQLGGPAKLTPIHGIANPFKP